MSSIFIDISPQRQRTATAPSMVQYSGFLIERSEEDWLVERGLRRNFVGTDDTPRARADCIAKSLRDVVSQAGLFLVVKFVKVQSCGKQFWCVALGSTDPRDGLPDEPAQKHVDRLRTVLKKAPQVIPQWYAQA